MPTTLRRVSGGQKRPVAILGMALFVLAAGCSRSPEARKALHMKRAEGYLEKGDFSRAVVEFKVASQNVPGDPEPLYRLGVTYLRAGSGLPALETFQRVLKLDATHEDARYQVALFAAGSGKPGDVEEAKQTLRSYLRAHPEKAEAMAALALAEAKLDHPEEALRLMTEAAAKDPGNLRPVSTLIAIYSAKGDAAKAKLVADRIAERLPKSAGAAVLRAQVALSSNDLARGDAEISRALGLERNYRPALELRLRRELMERNAAAAEQTGRELAKMPERDLWAVYGRLLFAEQKVDEGMAEFQRVLREHNDDLQVRNEYSLQLARAGRLKEAEAVVDGTLKAAPKDASALLQRSTLLIDRGDLEGGTRDLNTLRGLKAFTADVTFQESRIFAARGETIKQGDQLTAVLKMNPQHRKARLELSKLLASSGKAKSALQILEEAGPNFKNDAEFLFYRNSAHMAAGNWAEARKGVDLGVKEFPTTGFHYQDAVLKVRGNDLAGARAALEAALQLHAMDLQALRLLGQIMGQQGQISQFTARVKELAAKNPGAGAVQLLAAGAMEASKDSKGARAAYEAAKAAGETVDGEYELARLDLQSGSLEQAKQRLEGLARTRDNVKTRLLLAQLEMQKDAASERAVEHYLQAMKLEPGNVLVMNNLASTLTLRNKLEDAEFWGRKAVALAPGNPVVADTLGWALYQRGKYTEALPFLDQSLRALDRPIAHYHLAAALTKTGDWTRARREYELGVKQSPQAEVRKLLRPVFENK